MNKTILITGINGYLGSKLAKHFEESFEIIGLEYSLDNLSRIRGQNYNVYESKDGIPKELFSENQIDYVIHAATFYGRDQESNGMMLYSNTFLPMLILEEVTKAGNPLVFINTDTVLNRFTNSYSLTKKQFKDWLKYYSKTKLIRVVNLKLEHFYGPGSSSTNFITQMTQRMLDNEISIKLTKAEQCRDFLFIDDLIQVFDLLFENEHKLSYYQNFNIGTGKNINLKYILEYIKANTSSFSKLEFGALPYRPNELMQSNNDISKIKKFGWIPKTSIELGLNKVIDFEKKFRSQ